MKKKQLTPQEKIKLIFDDFELFAKNFLYIVDNNNEVVPLILNEAQQDIEKMMKTSRFIAIGKSRQAGISVFTLCRALYRALTTENENILIVSYKSDSAKALFDTLKKINDYVPRERYKGLFPTVRRENRGELLFSNGSSIKSVTAGNKDVGRGSTYSYIHCSEFAFWLNQEKQLLSLEQSLQKGSNSQITIETTSNGMNYWYKMYSSALKGESKYRAYFVPFYHKLYKKQFNFEYRESENWYKANNKGLRLSKSECDDEELQLLESGASLLQLMWRRYKIQDMDGIQQFYQEYCATPEQSFISTGNALFDQTKVLQSMTNAITPLSKQDVIQQAVEFPESLLKYIGKGLNIFYLPEYGMKYYGGVDVAGGSSGGTGDNSTLSMFDGEGQQVLSFASNKVPVHEFAEFLNDIGRYYSYGFLCIERNSFGLPLIQRIRKEYNYMNLYKQKIFGQRGEKKMQLGMTTTQTTKSVYISDLKEHFEMNMMKIECKETLQEMQLFIDNNGRLGNKSGAKNRDDLVISTALAITALKANRWYVD